ncbi:MAG: D-TA family PLP-dependent enzyme [Pedobacter sp.]|nr:D-TA family PLP-dependent enzyme [Pedobacter sp.]
MIKNDEMAWYTIDGVDQLDTPALVVYVDRVKANIQKLTKGIDPSRLRPHVKTHKSMEVTQLLMEAGIHKFKCATISEAEMLGICMAKDVLLAYQPIGTKQSRLLALQQKYPATQFSCLLDNLATATELSSLAMQNQMIVPVFIDLNVGMDRTGIWPEKAVSLAQGIAELKGLKLVGLHAYDGHIEEIDLEKRTQECLEIYNRVAALRDALIKMGFKRPTMVMGGSPSFPIYSQLDDIECSPGTFVYWDENYLKGLPEQDFLPAMLVLGRIISMPGPNMLTVDIGHKSISSEYPLDHRIRFLNAPELRPISHSEEHMVVSAPHHHSYQVGEVLYGLPYHVCPTCALHDYAISITAHHIGKPWKAVARNRVIEI